MIFGTCGQRAPSVGESTPAERRKYIEEHFRCISDCDMCGICAVSTITRIRFWFIGITSRGQGHSKKLQKNTEDEAAEGLILID